MRPRLLSLEVCVEGASLLQLDRLLQARAHSLSLLNSAVSLPTTWDAIPCVSNCGLRCNAPACLEIRNKAGMAAMTYADGAEPNAKATLAQSVMSPSSSTFLSLSCVLLSIDAPASQPHSANSIHYVAFWAFVACVVWPR